MKRISELAHAKPLIAACAAAIVAACVFGCANRDTVARPEAAFSGATYDSSQAAMSEKDGGAVLTSVAMQSWANADATPAWTYLYASKAYGKYYVVFNGENGSTPALYGDTRWNDAEWEKASGASKESIASVAYDADAAYAKVLNEYYDGKSNNPYRMALIVYDADNARTDDSPALMTWYIYVASQEKLDELSSESNQETGAEVIDDNSHLGAVTSEGSARATTYDDALEATYTVDALSGEVQKI